MPLDRVSSWNGSSFGFEETDTTGIYELINYGGSKGSLYLDSIDTVVGTYTKVLSNLYRIDIEDSAKLDRTGIYSVIELSRHTNPLTNKCFNVNEYNTEEE